MKAHRFDAWSFVGGLVLVTVGLLILIPDTTDLLAVRFDTFFDFVLPVLALVIGAAMVIPAIRRPPRPEPGLTPDETKALDELNQHTPPMA